jgi:hypothetical protein
VLCEPPRRFATRKATEARRTSSSSDRPSAGKLADPIDAAIPFEDVPRGVRGIDIAQQDAEFIGTDSRDDIAAGDGFESVRNFAEHGVAQLVTVAFVDTPETVEVDEGDFERPAGGDFFPDRFVKLRAIREAGQCVVLDVELDLLELRLLVGVSDEKGCDHVDVRDIVRRERLVGHEVDRTERDEIGPPAALHRGSDQTVPAQLVRYEAVIDDAQVVPRLRTALGGH